MTLCLVYYRAKNLAINQGFAQAGGSASYIAADDLARQSFEIDIQSAMEDPTQTETDYAQTALLALAGGLIGTVRLQRLLSVNCHTQAPNHS